MMKTSRMMDVVTVDAELTLEFASLIAEAILEADAERTAWMEAQAGLYAPEFDDSDAELVAWLRCHDASDPEYSDIYKDVYGVRPRW